jgi:hypothetical protein
MYKRFPYKSLPRASVMLMSSVWLVVYSSNITSSCKNYVLILLFVCLVMVVYKRIPYKSPPTAAVMLMSSVWHGVYSQ